MSSHCSLVSTGIGAQRTVQPNIGMSCTFMLGKGIFVFVTLVTLCTLMVPFVLMDSRDVPLNLCSEGKMFAAKLALAVFLLVMDKASVYLHCSVG